MAWTDWIQRLPGLTPDKLQGILLDLVAFVLIVVVGFMVGRATRFLYERSLRKVPTSGQLLLAKMFVLIAITVSLLMAMSLVYQVQPLATLATLGVVSLALGFGLQNTVANMAAGVSLSLDKPFDVGDRVRIGETWGDVVTIGMRSTRILTVNGDLVVVPNSMLDTREVWNYTYQENTKFRLDLPISISYDSSYELAASIMLAVARSEDSVLAYPEPAVRFMRFGESGQELQLRVWLQRADQRPAVRDRLLRSVKERFDKEGVLFPFPQRTISYLKDVQEPSPTPSFLQGRASDKPVVLVASRSRESAQAMASRIVDFVKQLDARMVALHVRRPAQAMSPYEAQATLNIYLDRAQHADVPAKAQSEVGDFADVLRRVARETGAKLVIFGRPQSHWLSAGWVRHELAEAQANCPVPVVIVDGEQEVSPDVVERWRRHLHPSDAPAAPAG